MKKIAILLSLIVSVSGQSDSTPPELTYFNFSPDTLDLTNTDGKFTATIGFKDDLSGLSRNMGIGYILPNGSTVSSGVSLSDVQEGALSDTGSYSKNFNRYSKQGEFLLTYISIKDKVGNTASYDSTKLKSLGYKIRYYIKSNEDTTPPELTYFNISPDTINSSKSNYKVVWTFGIDDDKSGFDYIGLGYSRPNGSTVSSGISLSGVEKGALSDTGSYIFNVNKYSQSGVYKINSITVYDRSSNSKSYIASEIADLGFPTQFVDDHNSKVHIKVPSQYSTIQAGIDAASDGDTVLVAAGTYTESINFNGKNIVVGSLYLTTSDTSYIASTIIDGNADERAVIIFSNGETSAAVLNGFTITNGKTVGTGAGLRIVNGSDPTLTNLIISGNEAYKGAGVFIEGSGTNPTLSNIKISNNSSENIGSGLYITSNGSGTNITNVTISGNTTTSEGGGIYI